MKTFNNNLGSLFAWSGIWLNRRDWFLAIVLPAIRGQRNALCVLIGTHGRRGILVGTKWHFHQQIRAETP